MVEKKLSITEANIYEVQQWYDKFAERFMDKMNVDKSVFAECSLSWVRYNAEWK